MRRLLALRLAGGGGQVVTEFAEFTAFAE